MTTRPGNERDTLVSNHTSNHPDTMQTLASPRQLHRNTITTPPVLNPKKRILSIQACRGLAAMLVVLQHLDYLEMKYFHTSFLHLFQFSSVGVDLFFVISGFVISSVTTGKFGSPRNAAIFLYHRLTRIYPILWIYSAVILAAFLYNPLLINATANHRVDILPSFLLIPTLIPALVMQSWTLSFEVYFYLFFFLLLFLPERLAPALLTLWAAIILVCSLFIPFPKPVLGLLIDPILLEFIGGCVLFHLYRRLKLHAAAGFALITISLTWLLAIILWTLHSHTSFGHLWIEGLWRRPALFGSFAFLFLFGLLELERSRLLRFARPLVALGDWSYSIYLSHIIVIELFGRAFFRLAPHLPFAMLFVLALSLPATVLTGYLSYTFLELPMLAFFHRHSPHGPARIA